MLDGLVIFLVLCSFLSGFFVARWTVLSDKKDVKKSNSEAVYAIFCGRINDPDRFSSYQNAAIPLAKEAGLEVVAVSDNPVVISGDWPYKGNIAIEKFSSMAALTSYRNSPDYLKAVELIGSSATTNFAIVLEACSESS